MKTDLNNIILKNAEFFLNNKASPGHNGPYKDPETMTRTHAHLSILFFKAFKISKKNKYQKEAIKHINFLLTKEARPHNYTFHYRNKKGKDTSYLHSILIKRRKREKIKSTNKKALLYTQTKKSLK